MADQEWWQTLFDEKYLETYLGELTPERTSKEVDFVVRGTELTSSDKVLDLACGHGRHSIELAERGFDITGLDYSQVFLEKAKSDAEKAGVKVEFIQGDMRDLPFDREFDVVLLLFTAFGYFSDLENRETLIQISKSLKDSGKFLIDVVNIDAIFRRFKENGIRIEGTNTYKVINDYEMGGIKINETQCFNFDTQQEHTHRAFVNKGKKEEYDFYLIHYTLDQYKKMLEESGLQFDKVWGDYNNNPQNESNFRAIILAHKQN